MIITRNILAEDLIQKLKAKINVQEGTVKTFDIRDVKRAIDEVANYLLKIEFFESNREHSIINPQVLARFPLAVQNDVTRPFFTNYVALTAPYINLPHNKGVQHVVLNNTTKDEAIPVRSGRLLLLKRRSLENSLEQQWAYELEGNKIRFNERTIGENPNRTLLLEGITTVYVTQVIIGPEYVGDDDTYPLSPELLLELDTLVTNKLAPGLASQEVSK